MGAKEETIEFSDIVLARVMHVLAVVLWIGGVGMVTTVLLPSIRRSYPPPSASPCFMPLRHDSPARLEITTALTGLSGFYMVWRLDLWEQFRSADFWWMHAMVPDMAGVYDDAVHSGTPVPGAALVSPGRLHAGANLSTVGAAASRPAHLEFGDHRRCGCGQHRC